uniref:cell envelope integrity TolA C-terminal domain-containing protein n=1 Tax=Pantoea sp. IMH TaxID=1267600 RepID=UPI0004694CE6|nr:cell envelope integrity TolA C-terminal domain-containing protein [Pantoea sp. IMH]
MSFYRGLALIMAGATGMLSGCQSAQHGPMSAEEIHTQARQQCSSNSEMKQEDCVYLYRMQYGIQNNFIDADRYKGRECKLTIEYGKNQRYSVLRTTGDEALCMKAWGVVSSAEGLPPPPPHFPAKSVLVFKPA